MDMSSNPVPVPGLDELVERARALQPLLAARSAMVEQEGRVSEEITAQIKRAGLHKLGQPRRFGGYGHGTRAMLEVGFELGRACASTSWCTMISNANAWFAAYWPLEVQEEVWGNSPDNTVCIAGIPTGKCKVVEGGFEVWGVFPYVSNCDNSDWIVIAAPLAETEDAAPETAWFLVERSELRIDHDSWKVAGLRGTGSKTLVRSEPLFVPKRRMMKLAQVIQESTPGRAIPDNNMAALNFSTLGGVTLVAPLLGAAQGALDWFTETMKTKVKSTIKAGTAVPAARHPAIQMRVGEASSRIEAAMALLRTNLDRFEGKVASGEKVTIAERVSIRRDVGFAVRQAVEAVSVVFEGSGASAMSLDVPIQRFFRDISAGARHVTLDTDGIFTMFGQERFGLDPVGPH